MTTAVVILSILAAAGIFFSVRFFLLWRRTKDCLRVRERDLERAESVLEDMYTIQAQYVVTESDDYTYSDINKRNKAIRKTLIYQVAQSISKAFKHTPSVEIADSGREIHSYRFLIKRI